MSEILTPAEVAEIEARCTAATPGPWYPQATDDANFTNAVYVGIRHGNLEHDNRRGLADGNAQQEPPDQVVAITLLQSPCLAEVAGDLWDENAYFIAHSRTDIPILIATLQAAWEALEFYADKANWVRDSWMSGIDADRGERARKALGRDWKEAS